MSSTTSGQRDTIVIIDDERDTLQLCQRIFRAHYNLILAASADEALDKVQGQEIAVALADQKMPGKTGLEFFLEFTQTHPMTSRVVMTAYTDLKDIIALINQGKVQGFVLKPWHNEQIKLTVAREAKAYQQTKMIQQLNERLKQEHQDMLAILREFDPNFEVPGNSEELKDVKFHLRKRVSGEVEKLFLQDLLNNHQGNLTTAAQKAEINRTYLYRLMRRHGLLEQVDDN